MTGLEGCVKEWDFILNFMGNSKIGTIVLFKLVFYFWQQQQ